MTPSQQLERDHKLVVGKWYRVLATQRALYRSASFTAEVVRKLKQNDMVMYLGKETASYDDILVVYIQVLFQDTVGYLSCMTGKTFQASKHLRRIHPPQDA